MNLSEEIKRLADLRDQGVLTPAEFDKAKQKLLETPDPRTEQNPENYSFEDRSEESIGKAANRYVSFQIVMAVIGILLFLTFAGPMMCSSRSAFGGAPSLQISPR
jgi:hypothetical protein